ncbi:uncharacterized protein [Diadema setosum]|uniref:uncharacterized protein n=1 Tax=Diadema setosum TaxID=31175 RepID=UPI003B3B276E
MATMEAMQEELAKLKLELQRREVFFPPKEKKIRPFDGTDGVDDFIEDIRAGMKLRKLKGEGAVDYVMAHLEGAARQEIRHRPAGEKEDAESILRTLELTFGDRKTVGQLTRQLFNRTQREEESVAQFGYALMGVAAKMEGKTGAPEVEAALKEQFQSGLRDIVLRREVRRLVKDSPGLSFLEVRDWAVEMDEGERSARPYWKAGTSCQVDATMAMGKMVEELTSAIKNQTEVLEKMRYQQGELAVRVAKLEGRSESYTRPRQQADPQSVECYRCGQRGHYARRCPQPPTPQPSVSARHQSSHQGN